jgi:hypothetical protein
MTKRVHGTKGLQVITEVAVVKQDDSKNCVGLFHFIPSTPNPLRWSKDFRYIYIGINPTSCLNIFYPPHMSCNKIVINKYTGKNRQTSYTGETEGNIDPCSLGLNNYKDTNP